MSYIDDSGDCEDQALVHTRFCLLFKCQEWRLGKLWMPRLVKREGQWHCPKCNGSYGADAVKPRKE
jgi:hypothetical protein